MHLRFYLELFYAHVWFHRCIHIMYLYNTTCLIINESHFKWKRFERWIFFIVYCIKCLLWTSRNQRNRHVSWRWEKSTRKALVLMVILDLDFVYLIRQKVANLVWPEWKMTSQNGIHIPRNSHQAKSLQRQIIFSWGVITVRPLIIHILATATTPVFLLSCLSLIDLQGPQRRNTNDPQRRIYIARPGGTIWRLTMWKMVIFVLFIIYTSFYP